MLETVFAFRDKNFRMTLLPVTAPSSSPSDVKIHVDDVCLLHSRGLDAV